MSVLGSLYDSMQCTIDDRVIEFEFCVDLELLCSSAKPSAQTIGLLSNLQTGLLDIFIL
jgi:hypothetical protein